jgi:hypothetical protein
MATTTTNFGWDIPQSTDLVKDGATAIAALGQDIDTAMVDLKGGTTGQVLAKASGTDLDFSWVAQDDSNAIQNAIVEAKGDLISATADDTPARLAVGTNDQVLVADSTTATGLKWATPVASTTAIGCGVALAADYSISNATYTVLPFTSENFDTNAMHDNTTNNGRITVPTGKGGLYRITYGVIFDTNANGVYRIVNVRKNGTTLVTDNQYGIPGSVVSANVYGTKTVSLNAGDYVEIRCYQDTGGALNVYAGTFFELVYIGA